MTVKKTALIIITLLVLILAGTYAFLETYDFNRLKPRIVQGVKKITGRDLEIGDLDFKLGYEPVLVARRVSLSNADWGSRPEMAEIQKIEITLSLLSLLHGALLVDDLRLTRPDVLIEVRENGETNFPVIREPAGSQSRGKPDRLMLKKMELRDGVFTYRDCRLSKPHRLRFEDLIASSGGMNRPIKIRLQGEYEDLPLQMAGQFGSWEAAFKATEKWPVDLELDYNYIHLNIKGSLFDIPDLKKLALNLRLKGSDLGSLGNLLGIKVPFRGAFAVSCRLTEPSPRIFKASELRLTLEENTLEGSADLNFSGRKPDITADLTARKIDLRPFWQGKKGEKRTDAARRPGKLFSDKPLPLVLLKKVNGRITLSVAALNSPILTAEDVHLAAEIDQGGLRVGPLQARLGGGSLTTGLKVEPQQDTYRIGWELNLADISLSELREKWMETGAVAGRIDTDLSLAGYGDSIASVMAALDGGVDFRMNDGQIANEYFHYLNFLGRDFVSNLFRLLNPFRKETDYTRIICSVCRLDVKDGVSEITALVVNTPGMVVVGEGRVDLKNETVDVGLKPSPKEGIGIEGLPRINLSLSDLTKPFKLGGTLSDPSLRIDTTQTALTIGKAVGGAALLGPLGVAAALLGHISNNEKDPCLAAIEAAEKMAREKAQPEKNSLKKIEEGVKKFLKELFE